MFYKRLGMKVYSLTWNIEKHQFRSNTNQVLKVLQFNLILSVVFSIGAWNEISL